MTSSPLFCNDGTKEIEKKLNVTNFYWEQGYPDFQKSDSVKKMNSLKYVVTINAFLLEALGLGKIAETNGRVDNTRYKLPTQTKVDGSADLWNGQPKSVNL